MKDSSWFSNNTLAKYLIAEFYRLHRQQQGRVEIKIIVLLALSMHKNALLMLRYHHKHAGFAIEFYYYDPQNNKFPQKILTQLDIFLLTNKGLFKKVNYDVNFIILSENRPSSVKANREGLRDYFMRQHSTKCRFSVTPLDCFAKETAIYHGAWTVCIANAFLRKSFVKARLWDYDIVSCHKQYMASLHRQPLYLRMRPSE